MAGYYCHTCNNEHSPQAPCPPADMERRMRCIEAATRLYGGRMGANQKDVLNAADEFWVWINQP